MDGREQRGLAIAALCKIDRKNGVWLVPSQSGNGKYAVIQNGPARKCSCPDYEDRQLPCKHIYAVEFVTQRELFPDGSETVTRSMTVTEKVTYRQDWPAYNDAQSHEKDRFQILLNDLCSAIAEPERGSKPGRKPHPVKDTVFASVFKVYSTFSSRRFSCDLRDAHAKGYTASPIPGAKVPQFLENPELTPILTELIARSAAPLKTVETEFAVDSSGFGSSRFERWYDHKYGCERQKAVWVKVHITCGVKTNIVTAVRILDQHAPDGPQLAPLMQETAKTFTVKEVSADKAYTSRDNFDAIESLGGVGFLAFRSNATGACGGLYAKMFHYFQYRREEFLAHYHKRSNVESVFSAAKRKFGDSVRSKTDVAMVNEALCKLLAHNICCLIQEQAELGIEPVFWTEKQEGTREVLPMLRQG
jgi:transposase